MGKEERGDGTQGPAGPGPSSQQQQQEQQQQRKSLLPKSWQRLQHQVVTTGIAKIR